MRAFAKPMKGAPMGADHITKDMTMQEILAVFPEPSARCSVVITEIVDE